MVSGKPPRHSKSTAEPVTIDLDAKDVKDIGKDKDTVSIEAKPATASQTDAASSKTSAFGAEKSDPKPIWDNEVKNRSNPSPTSIRLMRQRLTRPQNLRRQARQPFRLSRANQ